MTTEERIKRLEIVVGKLIVAFGSTADQHGTINFLIKSNKDVGELLYDVATCLTEELGKYEKT